MDEAYAEAIAQRIVGRMLAADAALAAHRNADEHRQRDATSRLARQAWRGERIDIDAVHATTAPTITAPTIANEP